MYITHFVSTFLHFSTRISNNFSEIKSKIKKKKGRHDPRSLVSRQISDDLVRWENAFPSSFYIIYGICFYVSPIIMRLYIRFCAPFVASWIFLPRVEDMLAFVRVPRFWQWSQMVHNRDPMRGDNSATHRYLQKCYDPGSAMCEDSVFR